MISKYRTIGIAAIVVASLTAVLAQTRAKSVASGHREILVQTTQSWHGKPYTHYPTGRPQLTTIKLTIAPHTALPWHTHPFPNVVYVLSGTLTLHDKASGKTQVVHQGQAVGESVDDVLGFFSQPDQQRERGFTRRKHGGADVTVEDRTLGTYS